MAEIRFLPPAAKFIKKLKDKKLKEKIKTALEIIAADYNVGTAKNGDLAGLYGYDVFYNKTNYEISYKVEEINDEIIVVVMIGTRENFYNELKRYMK